MRLYVAAATIALIAAPSIAAPKIDVQGLILGNEGARYVKGVPTLDLQQQGGAVQIRFLGWDHSNAVFAVGFFNAGFEPVNIGLEDLHASANGKPVRIFTVDELTRQAKNRAMWRSIGLAFLGGLGAAAAASQRDTYHGSVSGPYGTYSYSGSYPSLAGQLQANQISRDTGYGIALIQHQLDLAIGAIGDRVIQRTTVDPGTAYGGLMVVEKLDYGKTPLEFRLDVDWNSERYPFGYLLLKKGQAVPETHVAFLASKAKPRALTEPSSYAMAPQPGSPQRAAPVQPTSGAIALRSGAMKIPAKTPSGYCLRTSAGYIGTGSVDAPIVNKALPRCSENIELKGAP